MGSIPGSRRSSEGGHGNPLQHSCLENTTNRGVSQTTAQRITNSPRVLSCFIIWNIFLSLIQFSSFQSLHHACLFVTPCTAACQDFLSITDSQSLLKLIMSIESVMPSNHLILCHPLLLPSSIFPSIRVFSNELAFRLRWLKYWSFSFNISPSNKCPGLISFRMDWLDLLAVQGTLKSLLQHHSSKASHLQRSPCL